jgi:hypothetical protein
MQLPSNTNLISSNDSDEGRERSFSEKFIKIQPMEQKMVEV